MTERCIRLIESNQRCPFCGEEQEPSRLQSHLARHMQQIALFVVPPPQDEKPSVQGEDPLLLVEDPLLQEEDPSLQEEDPSLQEEDHMHSNKDTIHHSLPLPRRSKPPTHHHHHRLGQQTDEMAKTIPRRAGLRHKTSITSIVEQIDNDLYHKMKDFHNHSKDCKLCRNPVRMYEENRDFCDIGRSLSIAITKLLYKKAEHVGAFIAECPFGWGAVDGLIRITHYNQGNFSTQIVDLKRTAPAPTPVLAIEEHPRGSQWEEDMRREQVSHSRHSANPYGGGPRTSYLDTTTTRTHVLDTTTTQTQAAGSKRSVHFDSHVQVREFTKP